MYAFIKAVAFLAAGYAVAYATSFLLNNNLIETARIAWVVIGIAGLASYLSYPRFRAGQWFPELFSLSMGALVSLFTPEIRTYFGQLANYLS
jgi:hypothetical protein